MIYRIAYVWPNVWHINNTRTRSTKDADPGWPIHAPLAKMEPRSPPATAPAPAARRAAQEFCYDEALRCARKGLKLAQEPRSPARMLDRIIYIYIYIYIYICEYSTI